MKGKTLKFPVNVSGPIIAISGPPGSGKSSLCRALARRIDGCSIVVWDEYETMTSNSLEMIKDWTIRGAPYSDVKTPGLADELQRVSLLGPVVFETPLGRAHPETGPLIDHAIWLSCPPDIALARKINQLLKQAQSKDYEGVQEIQGWLAGYLEAYEMITFEACQLQVERVKACSDICLDAVLSVDELNELLVENIRL